MPWFASGYRRECGFQAVALQRAVDGPNASFGRTAEAIDRRVREHGHGACRKPRCDAIAAEQYGAHIREHVVVRRPDQGELQQGGRGVPQRDPLFPQDVEDFIGVAFVSDHRHRRACRERTEHVVDRQVESQRRQSDDAIGGGDSIPPVHVEDGVDAVAMTDPHTLWTARGPRGEDDVGKVVRGSAGRRVRTRAARAVADFRGCGLADARHSALVQFIDHAGVQNRARRT